jgi:hypothetical protein
MAHSDNSYDLNENDMTVGTDMMVNYLANSEKLRDEDERWYYTKNKDNNDDEVDDDFDSYRRSDNNSRSENNSRHDERDDRDNRDNRDDGHNDRHSDDKRTDNYSEGESNTKKSSNDKYIDEEYENLSPLEKRLRRLDLMRKLGELRDLGCKVTNYSIDDDYYMMKYEHELHTSIRNKRNWMGLYNHMLIGGVKLLELGNDRYNPFDFSLKGLSNEVGADKTTYYEILGEIYEHYNVPGKKMNPWFRLAVNLIGTVALVGGKNNAHKFLPKQAQNVENDVDMLENLRSRAMNATQNNQQNQNNQPNQTQNNLDEYMNKEHDKAAQRVKDLENLKQQELEFQRFQKMLAEDNNKFSNMKKQLEMSQQSPDSERMRRSQASSKSKSISKSASKKRESTESDSRSTMTVTSTQSTQSTVSVNKKLASQFNKNSTIKASSISFGSATKGNKKSISIGK